MYEMVCDINPDAGRVLNLIGLDPTFLIEECRLRDVYLSKDKTKVVIFTKIGGGNRESYSASIKRLKNFKGYIRDYDDDFDNTYGTYVFNVPEKWKNDFEAIKDNRIKDVSDDYVNYVKEFFPTLAENGTIDKIFREQSGEE